MEIVGDAVVDGLETVSTSLTVSNLTANGLVYASTAGLLATTAAATNGQLLIGSTGAAPVAASLTGTANEITVTSGAGSLTVSLPSTLIAPGSIQTTGVLTVGGTNNYLALTSVTTEPTTPTAGTVDVYSESIAGYEGLRFINSTNADSFLQPSLASKRIIILTPGTGTGFVSTGTTLSSTGTIGNPSPLTSVSLLTSVRTLSYTTGTTAQTYVSIRSSQTECWRGNAAGLGGFFFVARFGVTTLVTGNRIFIGLTDNPAAPSAVVYGDPTTNTTPGKVGMAINASTGNWDFVNNVTGTVPTITALGANFPVTGGNLFELILFSAPNGSNIQYKVTNLSTGTIATGTLTTNIPASGTFLGIISYITNNATAVSAVMQMQRIYLESDN